MTATPQSHRIRPSSLPSSSHSITNTDKYDAYDQSQRIYEQIFGVSSLSQLTQEYITSGRLLNDLHLRIFPIQTVTNNTKTNKEKVQELIDIIHQIGSSDECIFNILLPEYHTKSPSSFCAISNVIDWDHLLEVFRIIITYFTSNPNQTPSSNKTSSTTTTPSPNKTASTTTTPSPNKGMTNESHQSNQNITINDTYTPPLPKCNNLLQTSFLSQQQHRPFRRIHFADSKVIHTKTEQNIEDDGDVKAFSPIPNDTDKEMDTDNDDDIKNVKKCCSPPPNQILLSAKQAMSAMRVKNLDNALYASGRKMVRNMIPKSRKTKKCTPGIDRRKPRRNDTVFDTNNTLALIQSENKNKNNCKLTKKLSFVNEAEFNEDTTEHKDDNDNTEHKDDDTASISSHYGWKSRDISTDIKKPLNISMLSHVLVDINDDNDELTIDNAIVDELKEQIEELEVEICNKNMSIQEYDNKLTEKSAQYRRVQHDLDSLKQEYQDINQTFSSKLSILTEDNTSLKDKLSIKTTEYENKCSSFIEVLNQKEQEIKDNDSKIVSTENELNTIKAKFEILKKRESKKGQIELCKSKLLTINADYDSLQKAVTFQLQRTSQEFKQIRDSITQGLKDGNYGRVTEYIYNYNDDNDDDDDDDDDVDIDIDVDDNVNTMDNIKSERDELKNNLLQLNLSYQTEKKLRKKLLEEIIDLKGNIRVFCRIRPKMKRKATNDEKEQELMATTCLDDERIVISDSNNKKEFSFDNVYKPGTNQERIFDDVRPLIHSCVDGYNVCIFAYGQTGSGKTYTMEGSKDNRGVIYRSFDELFDLKNRRKDLKIYLSVLEIYNEKIRDLLRNDTNSVTLKAKLSKCGKKVLVPGLTKIEVITTDNVRDLLINNAYMHRATGVTNMNEHSSRSHALVFVDIVTPSTSSRLVLIDLAGSERVKKTGVIGAAFDEARAINKSLSALGNVINSLQTKQKHIPFRDSQLTYLLYDCLGGNSRALMFCNISCELFDVKESMNTLLFANRVRRVQLGEAQRNDNDNNNNNNNNRNQRDNQRDNQREKLKKYKKDLEEKDKEINHLKMNNRNQQKEITKLTSSIDVQSNKNSNHHQTRVEFNNLQKEHSRIINDLEKKDKAIKKLNNEITDYKHKFNQLKQKNTNIRPRTATLNTLNRSKNPRKRKLPKDDDSMSINTDSSDLSQPAQKRRKMNNYGLKIKRKQIPSYQAPTRNSRGKSKTNLIKAKSISSSTRSRSTSLDNKLNNKSDDNRSKRRSRINSLDSVHSLNDVTNTINKNKKPLTPTSAIEALKNESVNTNKSNNNNNNNKKDNKMNQLKRKSTHVPITVSSLQMKSTKSNVWK